MYGRLGKGGPIFAPHEYALLLEVASPIFRVRVTIAHRTRRFTRRVTLDPTPGPSPESSPPTGGMQRLGPAMQPSLPQPQSNAGAAVAFWIDQLALHGNGLLYLALTAASLVVALLFVKRVLAPVVGALVQAVAATAVVGSMIGAAMVLLVAAVISGH